MKKYEGVAVEWNCELFHVEPPASAGLTVTAIYKSWHLIVCTADEGRYPDLKLLKRGAPIRIKGQIGAFLPSGVIALDDPELFF